MQELEPPRWYYQQGVQRFGPVPLETLRDLYESGLLEDWDLVWISPMKTWQRVGDVRNEILFDVPTAQPAFPYTPGTDTSDPLSPFNTAERAPGDLTGDSPFPVTYASFWRRVWAYLIDTALLGAILFAALYLLAVVGMFNIGSRSEHLIAEVLVNGLIAVAIWFYYAIPESTSGSTPGKHIAGIVVLDVGGHPISFARATGRFVAKVLSGLPLGAGWLFPLWTARRQALHDILIGCAVISLHHASQRQEARLQPASPAARAVATGLDCAIFLVGATLFLGMPVLAASASSSPEQIAAVLVPLVIAGFVAYLSILETRSGTTIGKTIMGIHVTDTGGAPFSMSHAIVRNLVKAPLVLLIVALGVGGTGLVTGLAQESVAFLGVPAALSGAVFAMCPLLPIWGSKRQGLHDLIAACRVVKGTH